MFFVRTQEVQPKDIFAADLSQVTSILGRITETKVMYVLCALSCYTNCSLLLLKWGQGILPHT
jgi:hypothetical protein